MPAPTNICGTWPPRGERIISPLLSAPSTGYSTISVHSTAVRIRGAVGHQSSYRSRFNPNFAPESSFSSLSSRMVHHPREQIFNPPAIALRSTLAQSSDVLPRPVLDDHRCPPLHVSDVSIGRPFHLQRALPQYHILHRLVCCTRLSSIGVPIPLKSEMAASNPYWLLRATKPAQSADRDHYRCRRRIDSGVM